MSPIEHIGLVLKLISVPSARTVAIVIWAWRWVGHQRFKMNGLRLKCIELDSEGNLLLIVFFPDSFHRI